MTMRSATRVALLLLFALPAAVAAGPPLAFAPIFDSYGLAFLAVLCVLAGAIAVGRAA